MREYSISDLFPQTWAHVVQAFWQRYPNRFSKHVLTEDTVMRKLCNQGKRLITRRIFSKTNKIPKWGEFLVRSNQGIVVEDSVCDIDEQVFTVVNQNISFRNIMVVKETCVYRPHPTDLKSTVCDRTTQIMSNFTGLSTALESFALRRYRKNTTLANKGFLEVLNKMFSMSSNESPSIKKDNKTITRFTSSGLGSCIN